MPIELFIGLLVFVFVAAVTPGPNNVMLLASGANFGFVRTLPHMAGVTLGFAVMALIVGFGVGEALAAHASLYHTLKWGGILYMLYLAWKIATAGSAGLRRGNDADRPFTFFQAALFQWVNVKAWAAVLTATAAYTMPNAYTTSLAVVVLVCLAVTAPSVALWTAFGVTLRRFLADPARMRIFNIAMAVLLVASFLPVVFASMAD